MEALPLRDNSPHEAPRGPAQLLDFPSHREKGFLNPDGPLPYDIEIKDWTEPKAERVKNLGYVETSVVTLNDDSRYVFRKTIPKNLHWDISVDFTLPLATRVNGYNTYVARQLAKSGMHSRIVGTNQGRGFSLLHDAQASLHILREDDKFEDPTCRPDESLITGYSMGFMKAMAMAGLAPEMDRKIPVVVGQDACLAEKVDYKQQSEDRLELARYLGREVVGLAVILGKNFTHGLPHKAIRRTGHYLSTIGLTKEYFQNGRDKWDTLATGETGSFAASVPTEQAMIMHFFSECRFNDMGVYKELYSEKSHPNVRIIEEDGYHLSGADPRVVKRFVAKINRAQHLLEEKIAPSELVDELTTPILRAA